MVATYGTEGDARPFAALCRGLKDAGHEARLLADGATLRSAQALGVPTTGLAGDIRSTLSPDHAIAGVVAKGGGFNTTARALAKIANENAESWLRTIKTLPANFLPIDDTPHDWLSRALAQLSITAAPVPRTPPHGRACLPSRFRLRATNFSGLNACARPASRQPRWMADGLRLRQSPERSTSPLPAGYETAPSAGRGDARGERRCGCSGSH